MLLCFIHIDLLNGLLSLGVILLLKCWKMCVVHLSMHIYSPPAKLYSRFGWLLGQYHFGRRISKNVIWDFYPDYWISKMLLFVIYGPIHLWISFCRCHSVPTDLYSYTKYNVVLITGYSLLSIVPFFNFFFGPSLTNHLKHLHIGR